MAAKKQIEEIRRDLIELFGKDDALISALEIKIRYHQIGQEFYRLRKFCTYEKSLDYVCQEFFVSKSTAKRAIQAYKGMVHENGLKSIKQNT